MCVCGFWLSAEAEIACSWWDVRLEVVFVTNVTADHGCTEETHLGLNSAPQVSLDKVDPTSWFTSLRTENSLCNLSDVCELQQDREHIQSNHLSEAEAGEYKHYAALTLAH